MGEVGDVTRSLCGKVDAIELFGNAAHAGFARLIKVAKECKVPVFSPSPFEVMQGAIASFYPDFQEGGVVAGKMIARVLKGESPGDDPLLPADHHQDRGQSDRCREDGSHGSSRRRQAGRHGRGWRCPAAMKIDAARDGGSVVLQLEGRLDREWAEHLSDTLEDLLQDGVRSLSIDFSGVTYVSSEATKVLTQWQQELALLRGEVQLTSLPPVVREVFEIAGWDPNLGSGSRGGPRSGEMRRSYWHTRADIAANGDFELSSCTPAGTLTCRLVGDPTQLTRAPIGPDHCQAVSFPDSAFGLGVGAIGGSFEDCRDRMGELISVAGCMAYFPSDGSRMADYLVGGGTRPPRGAARLGAGVRRWLLSAGAIQRPARGRGGPAFRDRGHRARGHGRRARRSRGRG